MKFTIIGNYSLPAGRDNSKEIVDSYFGNIKIWDIKKAIQQMMNGFK